MPVEHCFVGPSQRWHEVFQQPPSLPVITHGTDPEEYIPTRFVGHAHASAY